MSVGAHVPLVFFFFSEIGLTFKNLKCLGLFSAVKHGLLKFEKKINK